MRERLRAVRGEIVITSEPTAGTTIEVHVPVDRAVASELEFVGEEICKT